jgi:hypothetical protein
MNDPGWVLPDYEEFQSALQRLHSSLAASECHGLICAWLTRSSEQDGTPQLSATLFGDETDSLVADTELARMLARLVLVSSRWLRHGNYDLRLFLPGDSLPLGNRVQALADWCRGYIMGLLEAGVSDFDALPDQAAEVMRDLVAVSELNVDDGDSGTDEDLMQVEEYVRVGAQLMHETLNIGGAES